MLHNAEYRNFPHLTAEEFAEVCHLFDSRYRQATLGPLRKRWRVQVLSAFDMAFDFASPGQATYVQIIRPLEATLDHEDLSSHLTKFSFGDDGAARAQGLDLGDEAMIEAEESDEVHRYTLFKHSRSRLILDRPRYIGSPSLMSVA